MTEAEERLARIFNRALDGLEKDMGKRWHPWQVVIAAMSAGAILVGGLIAVLAVALR